MGKTEVYSWRLEPALKRALEEAARSRNESLAELLDALSREWLADQERHAGEDQRAQVLLHATARRCFGTIDGGDRRRAETARERVRGRLTRRRAG
jgi:hypothetical protein